MAYDKSMSYEWRIARGLPDHTVTTINAYCTTVSNTTGFILSTKNLYAMTTPTVNTAGSQYMRLTSTDAKDATAGVGCPKVVIEGVNDSGNFASEIVELEGNTPETTTAKYVAINRMYAYTCGSELDNAGIIYITGNNDSTAAGVPKSTSGVYGVMAAGDNRSADARFLVASGWTAYIQYVTVGQNLTTRDLQMKSYIREPLKPKQLQANVITDSRVAFDFRAPIRIPEKTYWWVEAIGAASATSADIVAQIILVNEDS